MKKKNKRTARTSQRKLPPKQSDPSPERYHLQLYITGTAPRSTEAVNNLHALCEEHLPGRYDLEIIDLYQEPSRAASGQIIASPTLVKSLPKPLFRMVGNLANREQLLIKLQLLSPPLSVPSRP